MGSVPRAAERLGDDMRGPAGQEAPRQIATQLAAGPCSWRECHPGSRSASTASIPGLLRGAPEIVPWLLKTVGAVRASDFMASWGLAISEEHGRQTEPLLRAQSEAVESGLKPFYDRLRSKAPIDALGLADAALDDFEDLTRALNQIKGQVVG